MTAVDAGQVAGRLGDSITRPDGVAKVQGSFAFSGDLSADGFLWGATLRSPHPYARIVSIDVSAVWRIDGVAAVITAEDVPGKPTYGLIAEDQPVFASEVVRFVGEPVAAVAANHPETCRRALDAIVVTYEVLDPLIDPEVAIAGGHEPIHPDGNVFRHQRIVCGDQTLVGDVVVEGTYELGMQDQAFLGLEAALAVPGTGGESVELYVATQWLHEDRKQIAACLDLDPEAVLLTLGGVGGAFGRARTSACRCTPACWRCAPDDPSVWRTAARRASSATSTATRRRSGCAITRRPTAGCGASRPDSCSTAGPTRRRPPPC